MRRPWTAISIGAALVCCVAAPLCAQTRVGAEWIWIGAAGAGQTVTIDAVRGHVRVLRARGAQLEVRAVMQGDHDPPESVAMVVDTSSRGLVFRTKYGGLRPRHLARRPECLPADTLHGEFWYSDVRAELTVRVPTGVSVAVRLMWGDIEATTTTNPLDLRTQNGTIR
jgi:hypothetical protein